MKKIFWSGVLTVIMILSLCSACKSAGPDNTERGTLTVKDVTAWIDYPAAEFYLEYEKPEYAEELTYEYDKTKLYIDEANRTVKALADSGEALSSTQTADKTGRHKVKVSSEHFSASFYVDCYRVKKDAAVYSRLRTLDSATLPAYLQTLKNKWSTDGVNGATTLFIGDSFFDTRFFWTEFYKTFEGTNAISLGISSTATYDWEVLADDGLSKAVFGGTANEIPLLKNIKPKNLVVNIGTNNVWMENAAAEETLNSLQRLFTMLHGKMPDTKIYYYGMAPRGQDTGKTEIMNSINARMKAWCNARKWIKYINTCDKLTLADLNDDMIHPKAETYAYYVEDLFNAGIKF